MFSGRDLCLSVSIGHSGVFSGWGGGVAAAGVSRSEGRALEGRQLRAASPHPQSPLGLGGRASDGGEPRWDRTVTQARVTG